MDYLAFLETSGIESLFVPILALEDMSTFAFSCEPPQPQPTVLKGRAKLLF